ncbi:uncharacterized protein SCHCODRAFT_02573005 [Schizophyllum commune H4-8]|uniref:F-box domain-containing protein n=1 Tax=Schizophyllum commune (strain H4-8 / FGSC 9210) TaxID=578458 RepID=D8Q1H5_SCHCM|nr:uncharacterized protein SCHCODRAFT_02573005 [Schizophyllum commune H4-8]KAI5895425.1 hypothetical protein SCHCODRAFT_02573005 [Schizophyllum commune H4-8]
MPILSAPKPPVDDSDDLRKFREAWKAEVQRRRGHGHHPSTDSTAHDTVDNVQDGQDDSECLPSTSTGTPDAAPRIRGKVPTVHPTSTSTVHLNPKLTAALDVYRRAVQCEQRGALDDALTLYRQAFRMEPNIDRLYQREEMILTMLEPPPAPPSADETLAGQLQKGLVPQPAVQVQGVVTGTLASVIAEFPHDVSFQPEDETQGVPLNMLPDEILVHILLMVDVTTLERFATVSQKTRLLTLDSGIWRALVVSTYQPPQVPSMEALTSVVASFQSDYRRLYIEHPRVRLDGVYIAVCHYVRQGLSENHWVNISHLITYNRFLRFFPNGDVLTLLANEEHAPKDIIPQLKPELRMQGLLRGHWRIVGDTVELTNLMDASGRYEPRRPRRGSHAQHNPPRPRYAFTMDLQLRSRPLGRWNKLEMASYNVMNLETGDISPVALKNERPFWFSKVKSYAS